METAAEFQDLLQHTSDRILRALKPPNGGPPTARTAWELKMELKVPNSLLYIALGTLVRDERIVIEPHELTYKVRAHATATIPSQV